MAQRAKPVNLSEGVIETLKKGAKNRNESVKRWQRAQIVLAAADGLTNREIAARLGVHPDTCSMWRSRFRDQAAYLEKVEKAVPERLEHEVYALLDDQPGSGRPCFFDARQITWIKEMRAGLRRNTALNADGQRNSLHRLLSKKESLNPFP